MRQGGIEESVRFQHVKFLFKIADYSIADIIKTVRGYIFSKVFRRAGNIG